MVKRHRKLGKNNLTRLNNLAQYRWFKVEDLAAVSGSQLAVNSLRSNTQILGVEQSVEFPLVTEIKNDDLD